MLKQRKGRHDGSSPAKTERIGFSKIDPPKQNPRRDFDDVEIASLADSIRTVGQLQPVIVRPIDGGRYELVAGERRMRAMLRLEWKECDASVRNLTDREAAEIRLLENLDRKSLNDIEEATSYQILSELGHSPASIAALVRGTEDSVSLKLALLTLPDEWQARVRRGELSGAAAEYLVPWSKRQAVLDAVSKHLAHWPMPLVVWKGKVLEAVMALSRSMGKDHADGPRFPVKQADRKRLDVVRVEIQPGRFVERAMNAGLWDELQSRAAGEAAPAMTSAARRVTEIAAAQHGQPVLLDDEAREADFAQRLSAYKVGWYQETLCRRINGLTLPDLVDAAKRLCVDVDAEWRLTRPFCEMFANGRLEALATELGVETAECRDDRERMAVMLHASPRLIPSAFREAL
ncbi:MAG: ParB/RepB/Spo0J family partition protein [Blastocatellales bacterium]